MYEQLIQNAQFPEAVRWCEQRTIDPETNEDLTDLSVATYLIRAEAAELLAEDFPTDLEDIRQSFREKIVQHLHERIAKPSPEREAFLEMRILRYMEAKWVLDLIENGRWALEEWRKATFTAGLKLQDALEEERMPQGYDQDKRKSESGEHLALCAV